MAKSINLLSYRKKQRGKDLGYMLKLKSQGLNPLYYIKKYTKTEEDERQYIKKRI